MARRSGGGFGIASEIFAVAIRPRMVRNLLGSVFALGVLVAAVVHGQVAVSQAIPTIAGIHTGPLLVLGLLALLVMGAIMWVSSKAHLPAWLVGSVVMPVLVFGIGHPPGRQAAQPAAPTSSSCHMLNPAPEAVQQWRPEQVGNAQAIVQVTTIGRGLPPRAAQIALATALAESGLENLPSGDRDSLGLFQQRPSQGWGSPAQVMDPAHATNSFLDRMVQIPSWPERRLGEVAQDVQRSAHASGDIYDAEAGPADGLVQALVACS